MGGFQQVLVFSGVGALDGIPVGTWTPASLLAIIILLIALGKLVPRRTLDDVISDRNDWKAAHQTSEQARLELQGQVAELLEHSRATDAFLRALPVGAARGRTDIIAQLEERLAEGDGGP